SQILPGRIRSAGTDFPVGRLHAVVADQVHDAAAALLHHDREHIAQAADIAHELELEPFLPVVLGEMLDDAASRRARIVDHDVDASESLVALLYEVLRVLVLAKVGRNGDDLAPGCLGNFSGRCFKRFLAARAHRDIDAFFGQRQCNALTDAFAAAGDQRRLAFELEVHCYPLVVVSGYASGAKRTSMMNDFPDLSAW